MRIVSLLPSATEIVFALGLDEELVGRTDACDHPPEAAAIPIVARSRPPASEAGGENRDPGLETGAAPGTAALPGAPATVRHDRTPAGAAPPADRRPQRVTQPGRLDLDALRATAPDLVLAGEECGACGIGRAEVVQALRSWGSEAEVIALEPASIEGILHTITTVGAMTSAEDEAIGLVELLRERLGAIEAQVQQRRAEGVRARRVVALEWLDPPYASGLWIPEQIRRAGGWDVLGAEGRRAVETTWEAVAEVDPEQILFVPCGLDAREAAAAWERVRRPPGWHDLRAVRHGEVFALDARSYFTRPGPRVIEGIAMLAELFDPGGFVDEAPTEAWIPLTDP